ncbi:class I SAM-dependent methyltransferase [Fodinibius salsisoli]|uniref:Class I SAM-dependent methyltransferase n=1 Tax=Fodinibius salsisoli TaxID=2820877 RepID=A0ABT3PLH0_9BACT|nr:methyltransferase domain-containing protein [Fodinibius salsisoli]MCW9706044.1 class I SAM-dependent methyltransferase [Fodinibius salsisoli]
MPEPKWEQFAREEAKCYVDTNFNGNKKDFFNSGQSFVEQSLEEVLPRLDETARALEIGCGVGRLTFPHAVEFDEVLAVDVAPTMLAQLEKHANQFGVDNIETYLPDQPWHTKPVNFVYSYLVFQHIPDLEVIRKYIKKIASCLKPNGKGMARLQFDTRPATLLYRCRNNLPDWLLPKNQRQGIRRIRRKPNTLEGIFQTNNLSIVRQQFTNSTMHTFLLEKID